MNFPSEAVTAESVRHWLSCGGAEHRHCIVRGPVYRRENSRVFYAECDALPSALAVKWCVQPSTVLPDGDAAARQFEALRRAAVAMRQNTSYSVPHPYRFDRERALLAVEWIPGETMTASIGSWKCDATGARLLLARAGQWLRLFHLAHPLPDGRLDVEEKLRNLSAYDGCALARESVFARGLAGLRHSAPAAAAIDVERSWVHGDFKTDNLIVNGERIVGIDVQIRHENTVVYDIAPFMNHLELLFYHPAVWRLAPARARLVAAFVDGYSESKSDRLMLPLTWVRLYMILSAWNSSQSRGASRLRAAVLGRSFRTITARLSAQLRGLHEGLL
jgi:hypothetical protein